MCSSVYIHIPFCQDICSYCDFCKFYYDTNLVDKYLDTLSKEILVITIDFQLLQKNKSNIFNTIFGLSLSLINWYAFVNKVINQEEMK